MNVSYQWCGGFDNLEVNTLHAEGFDHVLRDDDWWGQVNRHCLGWVCARAGGRLVGFVKVAWDGGAHAFILDTLVAIGHRQQGVGTQLVAIAARQARAAGCQWLHVDFEARHSGFYLGACGFTPTSAGLAAL